VNENEANKNDAIIMGNGTNETAAKWADLPGIVVTRKAKS
jgi:hypothetical protein